MKKLDRVLVADGGLDDTLRCGLIGWSTTVRMVGREEMVLRFGDKRQRRRVRRMLGRRKGTAESGRVAEG